MKAIFILFPFLLFGCATVKLTEAGKSVKVIELDLLDKQRCEEVRTILHTNEMKFGGALPRIVIGDIKNAVGETGANVGATNFNLSGEPSQEGRIIPLWSRIPVKAYKCPKSYWDELFGMN